MKRHRLQNRIVESVFTLPLSMVFTILVWWWPQGSFSISNLLGLLLCTFTSYVILETSNANALIRIRTRLIPSLWLVSAACTADLHNSIPPLLATCCLTISYSQLLSTYQRAHSPVQTFHTHLFLALGSLAFPPMLLFAFPFVLYQSIFMRGMSPRNFMSALIGLLLPYWFWAGLTVWEQNPQPLITHIKSVIQFPLPQIQDYQDIQFPFFSSWVLTSLLTLIGIIHYLRNRYDDKIRIRMILYIFISQTVLIQIIILLCPTYALFLHPLLMVSGNPLVAHYFALTNSRSSNIFFYFSILLFTAVAIINLWM